MNLSHSGKFSETSYIELFFPVSVFVQSLQPSVCIFHLRQYKLFSVGGVPINVVIKLVISFWTLCSAENLHTSIKRSPCIYYVDLLSYFWIYGIDIKSSKPHPSPSDFRVESLTLNAHWLLYFKAIVGKHKFRSPKTMSHSYTCNSLQAEFQSDWKIVCWEILN